MGHEQLFQQQFWEEEPVPREPQEKTRKSNANKQPALGHTFPLWEAQQESGLIASSLVSGEDIVSRPRHPDYYASLPPENGFVIVSMSGGKDSVATLLTALEEYGPDRVIAHHQRIVEDWPETVEYCQNVCNFLGVQLYTTQAHYLGYECNNCENHFLTSVSSASYRIDRKQEEHILPETVTCRSCGGHNATYLQSVESVMDLTEWRKMWPSLDVRFCTSYLKRDHFNMWARVNRDLFPEQPVIALGERWLESRGRAKLPRLRDRSGIDWMLEWRPVIDLKRIDVFRKMREYGIEPHYCYRAQGMTDEQMYDEDREGGPRMSCVMCFLKSPEQLLASYHTEQGRETIEKAITLERSIGHTLKKGASLEQIIYQP